MARSMAEAGKVRTRRLTQTIPVRPERRGVVRALLPTGEQAREGDEPTGLFGEGQVRTVAACMTISGGNVGREYRSPGRLVVTMR